MGMQIPMQAVQGISPPTSVPAPPRHPASDVYSPSSTNTTTVTTNTTTAAAAAAAPRSVEVHDVQYNTIQ